MGMDGVRRGITEARRGWYGGAAATGVAASVSRTTTSELSVVVPYLFFFSFFSPKRKERNPERWRSSPLSMGRPGPFKRTYAQRESAHKSNGPPR